MELNSLFFVWLNLGDNATHFGEQNLLIRFRQYGCTIQLVYNQLFMPHYFTKLWKSEHQSISKNRG